MKPIHLLSLALGITFTFACTLTSMIPVGSDSNDSDQQSPANSADQEGAGPKKLDLSDPALNQQATSSVSSHTQYIFESVDRSGAPYKVIWETIFMEQVEPQWASYKLLTTSWNGVIDPNKSSEGVFMDGKNYSVNKGDCYVSTDTYTHQPSGLFLNQVQELGGSLNRVEQGVVINGVLTDRYEIKLSNLQYSSNVLELRSGSLYRAREGGYLVRYEYVAEMQYDDSRDFEKEFDPAKPVLFTNIYELTYYTPGETFVKLPDLCVGK